MGRVEGSTEARCRDVPSEKDGCCTARRGEAVSVPEQGQEGFSANLALGNTSCPRRESDAESIVRGQSRALIGPLALRGKDDISLSLCRRDGRSVLARGWRRYRDRSRTGASLVLGGRSSAQACLGPDALNVRGGVGVRSPCVRSPRPAKMMIHDPRARFRAKAVLRPYTSRRGILVAVS